MHIYVIRHAEAVPLGGGSAMDDSQRHLTETGKRQCLFLGLSLVKMGVRFDRILTSPFVRARETAIELAKGFDESPSVVECSSLAPGNKKRDILDRIREQNVDSLAVVGHNPDLSELVGWFIGKKWVGINMEKSAVACLEFEGLPGKGAGTLAWLVTPNWCERLLSSNG
ncbi:MAG: phosphohistidine phosphatase SixA [Gemmataceae bacterium]